MTKNRIPRAIVVVGFVSLLTDISSEMIYPLLPLFLTQQLGAGPATLGLIESIAEATSSFFKAVSGAFVDRMRKRKPLIVLGYTLSGLSRPLMGLASAWPHVLFLRFSDRIGKGLRTAPRDALIADATSRGHRGRAYGFHRAMDHAGAVIGPLIAWALINHIHFEMRTVFLLAAIPAALAVGILVFGLEEKGRAPLPPEETRRWGQLSQMDKSFWGFIGVILIFGLANFADSFLLMRLTEGGVSPSMVVLLWSAHNLVKMAATSVGGPLSDRWGARPLMIMGWIYFAVLMLAMGSTRSAPILVFLFLLYGIHYGLVEPAERTMISLIAPAHLRGTAFGALHGALGFAALPSSLLFGALWQTWGVKTAFLTSALLAALAAGLLTLLPRTQRERV